MVVLSYQIENTVEDLAFYSTLFWFKTVVWLLRGLVVWILVYAASKAVRRLWDRAVKPTWGKTALIAILALVVLFHRAAAFGIGIAKAAASHDKTWAVVTAKTPELTRRLRDMHLRPLLHIEDRWYFLELTARPSGEDSILAHRLIMLRGDSIVAVQYVDDAELNAIRRRENSAKNEGASTPSTPVEAE
jgi:hypothetical protein